MIINDLRIISNFFRSPCFLCDCHKKCLDWLNSRNDLTIKSVVVDKQGKNDNVFELAWNGLLIQFENAIKNNRLNGLANTLDKGIVICDNTDGEKLTWLIRTMRHHKYKPTDEKLHCIIEDPILRESKDTLLLQMNDVVAYCVRQRYEINSYMKKKSGFNLIEKINDVVLKGSTEANINGIVELK